MEMTRISVPMTVEERELLQVDARRRLRHPRDHARHLLCEALGLIDSDIQSSQMQNRDASISQAECATVAQ
jgi:hypothetical protein